MALWKRAGKYYVKLTAPDGTLIRRSTGTTDRLKALENVVLTPHIAAASETAQAAQQAVMLGNLRAFFAGEPLVSPVPL